MNRNKSICITILCLSLAMVRSLPIDAQKVTFHDGFISLKQAFEKLESVSTYKIAYNDSQLDVSRKVLMDQKEMEVLLALSQLLKNTGYTYKTNGNYILIVPEKADDTTKDRKRVSGVIVDNQGIPVIGANVVEKGTANGTITDIDGKFTLEVSGNATLQVSYIGYNTQELSVSGKTDFSVKLGEDTQALDEVVVVGYGTQKKVNLTGAVQSISSQDLTKRNLSSSSQALQGLIPGMVVTQSSGAPGATASIQIRGTGSINSNSEPLVLIDGVEGDMNSVDMNAIESVSVLKDAASASIYGSRASNGVILVTTKRAKENKLSVSYNGYVGFRTPTSTPNPVDAVTYMEAINQACVNNNQAPQYSEEVINAYKTSGADNIHRYDTNWKDLVFDEITLTHNHSLSVSGGSDVLKTFVNASYNYEDGLIPNNSFKRTAIRSNTDVKLTEWLRAGLNLNIRRSIQKDPTSGTNNIINSTLRFTPLFGAVNNDGTWGNGQNGINPLAQAIDGGVKVVDNNDIDVKGTLALTPIKGMEILPSYASRRYENKQDKFQNTYDTYEGGNFIMTYPTTKSRYEEWYQLIKNQFNAQVTYENTFNERHYFKGFLGFQTDEFKNKSFGGSRNNYYYDGYEEMNHGDASSSMVNGNSSKLTMMSYFARFNYTFADKYLIELTGRYDGSSRFTAKNRWGFFPSVSIGWRISEEHFFDPLKDAIDNLKIRASYGSLGNQDLKDYYPYASVLALDASYWFGDSKNYTTGIYSNALSNPEISWEKSQQFDFGLDITAFNTRLDVTFDYYIREISDMLQQFPVTYAVGLTSPWENAGNMRNNGWDLSVMWHDRIGKVKYNIRAMLSDVKNEVTDLYGNKYINDNNTTQEGFPISSWYGYVADGYFQSKEEINNYPVYGNNKDNVKPGYIKYKDISGPEGVPDGQITDADRTIIGDPQPRYSFSLNLGAEWNNFDFNVFLQGVGKRDIFFNGAGARPFWMGGTVYEHQLDSWSEENRNAEYPLLLIDGSGGGNMNNIPSSFWVKSGAYMRLKNVSVGYSLPKNILGKSGLSNVRFYLSGQNLLTIAKGYKGYDPEGDVSSYYPVTQVYTFGVDIKF